MLSLRPLYGKVHNIEEGPIYEWIHNQRSLLPVQRPSCHWALKSCGGMPSYSIGGHPEKPNENLYHYKKLIKYVLWITLQSMLENLTYLLFLINQIVSVFNIVNLIIPVLHSFFQICKHLFVWSTRQLLNGQKTPKHRKNKDLPLEAFKGRAISAKMRKILNFVKKQAISIGASEAFVSKQLEVKFYGVFWFKRSSCLIPYKTGGDPRCSKV